MLEIAFGTKNDHVMHNGDHIGVAAEPGDAYMVRHKEDTQTEIYGMAVRELNCLREVSKVVSETVKRTNVTLGGYRIWQRQKDLGCLMIDPVYEGIMDTENRVVFASGDRAISVQGLVSQVYIFRETVREGMTASVHHLSQMQWTAVK